MRTYASKLHTWPWGRSQVHTLTLGEIPIWLIADLISSEHPFTTVK